MATMPTFTVTLRDPAAIAFWARYARDAAAHARRNRRIREARRFLEIADGLEKCVAVSEDLLHMRASTSEGR